MMKKTIWLSALIVIADQALKAFVRSYPIGQPLFRIPGVLEITHQINTGAAFSLLSGQTALLALLSAALLAIALLFVSRAMRLTGTAAIAFSCLLGGGVGNLMDRLMLGGVTDYIRILPFRFPVFNLADVAITASIGVLIVLLMIGKLEKATGEEHGSDH